jgi:rod shape-determining protein MreD
VKQLLLQQINQTVCYLSLIFVILLLIVINTLPLHIPGFVIMAPLLPLIGIHYLSIYQPGLMSLITAFVIGLINDAVSGFPLGISSLIYLFVYIITVSQRYFFYGKSFYIIWYYFCLISACSFVLQCLLISLLLKCSLEIHSLILEFLMTLFLYPIISWILANIQLIFYLKSDQ